MVRNGRLSDLIFQSTLSVRRATGRIWALGNPNAFQSTLSVRRATRSCRAWVRTCLFQSTLSVRRATCGRLFTDRVSTFQSTLSVRRATRDAYDDIIHHCISIHALREESDPLFEDANHLPQ